MMKKKKIYTLVILVVLMAFITNSTAFACSKTPKIKVTVNKETVKYDVSPYLSNGEVMVPVEETAEALDGKVEWDKKNNTAWIHLTMTHVELIVGKSEFYIHRDADFSGIPQTVKLSTRIKYSKGSVLVPAKTVFESLGMTVTWDSKTKILAITGDNSDHKDISYTELSKDNISNMKEVSAWYQRNYTKAGIHSMRYKGIMYVLASAGSKPTGGYSVGISSLTYETSTKAFLSAYLTPPSPNMMVTQVETFPHILIKIEGQKKLRSVKGEIKDNTPTPSPTNVPYEEITFDQLNNNRTLMNWYFENDQKPGITYIKDGAYIYALIGAGERPTGGYTIRIDKIYYSTSDTVIIDAKVAPPGDNVRVMMVISYPSMLIRIKSETIKSIIGDVYDTKISWVTLDLTTVTKMELYNLDQVKLRDITGVEKDEIMQAFNNATVDFNPYIKMIAGKILKVATTDGYLITFSSYGSETNVIASLEKNGVAKSFHLLAPGIAKYIFK
jgi:hypothetical protein